MGGHVVYRHEYEQRIRVGYIGCGGHSYRNILPTFQYAPIDLIAVCDLDESRASAFARQFGAERYYTDYRDLLRNEELDAVFVVTNYDQEGEPLATTIVGDALRSGKHVWTEKPQSGCSQKVKDLIALSESTGKWVLIGYKKMFFPAIVKAKALMQRKDFGNLTSCYVRYSQALPPFEDRSDGQKMVRFLDHIVHPASIISYLAGPIHTVQFLREPRRGGSVTLLSFVNGAVGTLHLAAGQSRISPHERLEMVGEGANLVVDNGVFLTYYRPGGRGEYGRAADYLPESDDQVALTWSPEFSLGQLYNKNIFMLGYAQEVRYFAECILNNEPPERANLATALEMARLYEAYLRQDGEVTVLHPLP